MPSKNQEFATYCCDLLGTIGPCVLRRMFGGFGISRDGLTVAIMTDLGQGERLWLKADEDTRPLFEAAGCQRFGYLREGVSRGMNYYSAPEEAMDSPQQMAPWARLALEAALKAKLTGKVIVKVATKAKPKSKVTAKTKVIKATVKVAVKKSQNPVKQPK